MSAIHPMLLFSAMILIQVVGLSSVIFARLSEHSWAQAGCQRFFFVCLLCVGVATVLAAKWGSGCWLSCGATLSLMSVGATLDLRPATRAEAF
jgi:hypothetical protein